eukprot:gene18868-biopygen19474
MKTQTAARMQQDLQTQLLAEQISALPAMAPEQQAWLDIETDRSLRSGAWEFMQFDIQGVLYQCGALPFGWSDSPRIFVKLMKTLVELIRSPQAGKDRHEVKKLRDGQEVRRRWAVRRREGGLRRGLDRAGARVLPYMDDFMVITKTQVDFEEGLFRVTEKKLKKIHAKAMAILCRATRERRWVQAREVAGFNGLCQSVYLVVPTARLYLRELYFVLGKKSSWGSKQGEADEASLGRPTMVGQATGDESVKWAQDLWTEKLGDNQHSGTAAAMQASALENTTADNYERHWKKFVKFCTEENLQWLPATAATVQLYMAALQKSGTAMLRESLPRGNNGLSIVLEKEKGKNHLL